MRNNQKWNKLVNGSMAIYKEMMRTKAYLFYFKIIALIELVVIILLFVFRGR